MSEYEPKGRICKTCTGYRNNRGRLECKKTAAVGMKWSTGEAVRLYKLCDTVNHDGNCEMYEYKPGIWESLVTWWK